MSVASCVLKSLGDSVVRERYRKQNLNPPLENCWAVAAVMMVSESNPGTDGVEFSIEPGKSMFFLPRDQSKMFRTNLAPKANLWNLLAVDIST
jgi:hypothetical protein